MLPQFSSPTLFFFSLQNVSRNLVINDIYKTVANFTDPPLTCATSGMVRRLCVNNTAKIHSLRGLSIRNHFKGRRTKVANANWCPNFIVKTGFQEASTAADKNKRGKGHVFFVIVPVCNELSKFIISSVQYFRKNILRYKIVTF